MLSELVVRDLGVFAEARLELASGFVALTGETGAGKSLVVGAIDLLLGGRADAGLVRPGGEAATVDGRFVVEGEELVLSRVVPAEGRSRAHVNGRPVTASELSEVGSRIVELHGQHAHQVLLRRPAQRAALDAFGGIDLGPLAEARSALAVIDAALAELGGDERGRAREMDLLRYQLDELVAAALEDPDEDEEMDRRETLLADAEAHREAAATAVELLSGDGGVVERLSSAVGLVRGRPPFAEPAERLAVLADEVSEVGRALRRTGEAVEEDPEALDGLRRRRAQLAELRRKYGETLAEVIAFRDEAAERLAELERYDAEAAKLDHGRHEAMALLAERAGQVGRARRGAAPELAAAVTAGLQDLAMAGAELQVRVGDDDPGDDDPGEDVELLLRANRGGSPAPLSKVASGGELARTTLAVRLVLSGRQGADGSPPVMVFDEVDAGIGGEAAWAVGAALRRLTGDHQVLVVTHLAQVAAFADHHLRITKSDEEAATVATVETLGAEERVTELARMLSGQPESESGREHAAELLERARRAG